MTPQGSHSTRYEKSRANVTLPCLLFFFFYSENENDVLNMYLLKAVVVLALAGSLHLGLLSMNEWDQFRLSHQMSFDPKNSSNRAKSGLEHFDAVVSQLGKYSVCPVKLQNGKCLILSAT